MRALLLLLWVACGGAKQAPPQEAAPVAPVEAAPVAPAPVVDPATPEACLTAADCVSGVCEGEGCSDATPGVCMPDARACTRDLRPYCGCDGKTFQSGGNCPGARFAHRGPCADDPLPTLPEIKPPPG